MNNDPTVPTATRRTRIPTATAIHFVQKVVFSTAFPSQHCLYFLPLPQGQGSLRPVFAVFMTTRPPATPLPPTASLPRTHTTEKRYVTSARGELLGSPDSDLAFKTFVPEPSTALLHTPALATLAALALRPKAL